MSAVLWRFAPAVVFLVATAVAAAVVFLESRPSYDGMNYYDARGAVACLVYSAGVSLSAGWSALRTRWGARHAAACAALFWGLIAAALIVDLTWVVLGPGVEPMRNMCLGGMDCIGEELPSAPLTGDGWVLLAFSFLSVPVVAVFVLIYAFQRRPAAQALRRSTAA